MLWSKLKQANKIGTHVLCILIKMVAPQFSSSCEGREKKIEHNSVVKNCFNSWCTSLHCMFGSMWRFWCLWNTVTFWKQKKRNYWVRRTIKNYSLIIGTNTHISLLHICVFVRYNSLGVFYYFFPNFSSALPAVK